jgi:transcriptional regulator with PAS, ATPase and Fis domain
MKNCDSPSNEPSVSVQIIEENKKLKAQLTQRYGLSSIVGKDYKMLRMFELIESVADTRTTVLILGESGTGKTMTARSIHQLSNRRDKPFVEVACGASARISAGK